MKKKNEIVDISFQFALQIIDFCELLNSKNKYVISRQLLKSGTSIGANVREAQSAESRSDFIHKLKISHKEALETEYWLELTKQSEKYPSPTPKLEETLLSILKLLNKIIASAKKN